MTRLEKVIEHRDRSIVERIDQKKKRKIQYLKNLVFSSSAKLKVIFRSLHYKGGIIFMLNSENFNFFN